MHNYKNLDASFSLENSSFTLRQRIRIILNVTMKYLEDIGCRIIMHNYKNLYILFRDLKMEWEYQVNEISYVMFNDAKEILCFFDKRKLPVWLN